MTGSDVYQVKFAYSLPGGQPGLNVFWYQEAPGGAGDAADMGAGFQVLIQATLVGILPSTVQLSQLQVLNTSNFADSFVDPLTASGSLAAMSDVSQAVAFRKREGGIGTRYSYKRFPMPDGVLSTTTREYNTTFRNQCYDISVALGTVIFGADASYVPVQVRGGWQMTCTPANNTYCGEGAVEVNGTLTGQWEIDMKASHQDSRDERNWFTIADPTP